MAVLRWTTDILGMKLLANVYYIKVALLSRAFDREISRECLNWRFYKGGRFSDFNCIGVQSEQDLHHFHRPMKTKGRNIQNDTSCYLAW